ncbi:hypothetical protein [Mycobacterium nebraskense]|uniref:Uncharacterized protein n=1 Tax=Mycobacterium nebraskense TaxID=244292 RepID=A0A0F5N6S1_9MYCO|nr:hypothetical protein [Mycobacterium nebraskense]KKC02754.1 hypothetical protein WU83_22535 [Mycobacterium nebraskense]KLO40026.1 hypothetical protein ABW17_17710 [Mycobacterium nebraskense]MBI2695462.1 hypothetical protein [Mycobacterium nebraskense]MCV7116645.1 hypothetical protein [Mycobacterium nebraskense]ORW27958.1 hypothetical protein AWC17_28320 [Mycobacterium nebraskense]
MKKTLALGICLIVGIELLALIQHDRRFVLAASGGALALVLLTVRRVVGRGIRPETEADPDDLGDSLRRWLSNTETTIRWSESTRVDWDRHLRPMLARRYEMATGQRRSKDPMAYQVSGQMLFGTELWEWVNPNNVARTGDRRPGPGRAALEEILRKLEQV